MDGTGRGASVLALLGIGTTALVGIKDVPWLFWVAMTFYVAAGIVWSWPLLSKPKALKAAPAPDRVRVQSMIPLIEAATRSLEQTEHTIIPAFDKMFDSSPDGRLGWHCNALWERASIYGVEPPSRNVKEFPWAKWRHTYSMEVEKGVAFLQHRYEKTRIEKLQIREPDLKDAINKLLQIAGNEHDQSRKQ